MHWPGRQEKPHELLNFISCLAIVMSSSAQVTTQSSSEEVTMESQNRKRAPSWTKREVLNLITVCGDESVLSELRFKRRNAKIFEKISIGMKDRGYHRDSQQCRVKFKELRQAYQKIQDANARLGSEPQTYRFYDELHAILVGASITVPPLYMDSCKGGVSRNRDEDFGDEKDDEEREAEDRAHQVSGETVLPDSQELFITLDPIPSQPGLLDLEGGEGSSGECTFVNIIHGLKASMFND
ncbi:hypothetical protein UY3_01572 [Chelonia mydas]|uniref:Myb/SANT-like DNA-binding domain-containing protein n=1 Tax=Chelonia mydas TaxID=8469 RepID=M7BVC5_CHEMY|nr:hypothetical protein UY3_01572 [Chelonia mydas]